MEHVSAASQPRFSATQYRRIGSRLLVDRGVVVDTHPACGAMGCSSDDVLPFWDRSVVKVSCGATQLLCFEGDFIVGTFPSPVWTNDIRLLHVAFQNVSGVGVCFADHRRGSRLDPVPSVPSASLRADGWPRWCRSPISFLLAPPLFRSDNPQRRVPRARTSVGTAS